MTAETVLLADGNRWPLMEAVCCRSWPVIGARIGRCGYCGERPQVVGPWQSKEET